MPTSKANMLSKTNYEIQKRGNTHGSNRQINSRIYSSGIPQR